VGGSAQTWETILPAELTPGSPLEFNLVMTKFGPPAVRIAYEIRLEPKGG
jgi:hypothetical protein